MEFTEHRLIIRCPAVWEDMVLGAWIQNIQDGIVKQSKEISDDPSACVVEVYLEDDNKSKGGL